MRTGLTMVKEHDGMRVYIEISDFDIMNLQLDELDKALMNDVQISDPPADQLLVLEMLFRRMLEQENCP